jgi:hypothetical protein
MCLGVGLAHPAVLLCQLLRCLRRHPWRCCPCPQCYCWEASVSNTRQCVRRQVCIEWKCEQVSPPAALQGYCVQATCSAAVHVSFANAMHCACNRRHSIEVQLWVVPRTISQRDYRESPVDDGARSSID